MGVLGEAAAAWILLGVVLLGLATMLLSWTAGRLDRLHTRIESARAVLDVQLLHRSGATQELATLGVLDPATSLVLLDAAHTARVATDADKESAESDLTRALATAFADLEAVDELRTNEDVTDLVDELAVACRKVEMARRMLNDTVATTTSLRGRSLVRWARLAGNAPPPQTVEMVDQPPVGFQQVSSWTYHGSAASDVRTADHRTDGRTDDGADQPAQPT